MINIAIYSRKSKFTGKGDSIENQIQLCTEYAYSHFKDVNITIYEDEGFSGKNTDRPEFKRLLSDIKDKKVNILMCYRLDRISRNVADFSSTLEMLEHYNVDFISIKEQFDTTSPMGRAMTYISSVFAQLERETIAERVRDNMLQLSKTGRWLGGKCPFGFSSQEVSFADNENKTRKLYRLVPNEDIELVKLFFNKFLELGSLIKLESFLVKANIQTSKGKYFNLSSLKFILLNPVYACADSLAYNYFNENGYNVCSDEKLFDSTHGIMSYNRTRQTSSSVKHNAANEWIIAVGEHEPIISSKDWIQVQTIMNLNKEKTFRKVHSQDALLSGILRCECCGSYMRPKRSRLSADGTKYHYYYICELKEKSNRTKCNVKNLPGHTLDVNIVTELKALSLSSSALSSKIESNKISISKNITDLTNDIKRLTTQIASEEDKINNLLSTLELCKDSIASKYIISQINDIGETVKSLNEQLSTLKSQKQNNDVTTLTLDLMSDTLTNFTSLYDKSSPAQRRLLIKSIVDNLSWDGNKLYGSVLGGISLGEL